MPARTLSSVDLPVPLAPTMPTRSFGVISQFEVFEQYFRSEAFAGFGELNHVLITEPGPAISSEPVLPLSRTDHVSGEESRW